MLPSLDGDDMWESFSDGEAPLLHVTSTIKHCHVEQHSVRVDLQHDWDHLLCQVLGVFHASLRHMLRQVNNVHEYLILIPPW